MKQTIYILLLALVSCTNELPKKANSEQTVRNYSHKVGFDTISLPGLIGVIFEDVPIQEMDTNYIKELRIHPGIIDVVEDTLMFRSTFGNNLVGAQKASTVQIAYNQLIQLSPDLEKRIVYWTEYKDFYIFPVNEAIKGHEEFDYFIWHIYFVAKNDSTYYSFAPK